MISDLELAYPIISLLERSKANSESIINDLLDLVLVIDELGTILDANSCCISLFGISCENIIGRGLSDYFSTASWEIFAHHLGNTQLFSLDVAGSDARRTEDFILALDGQFVTRRGLLWTLKPMLGTANSYGKLFTVIGKDISQTILLQEKLKNLELKSERVRLIFDSALQGFITYGKDLKIEDGYSKRAEELLGEGLTGKNICDVLKLNKNSFAEFSGVVFQGHSWSVLRNFSKLESEINGRILKIELVPILEGGKVNRILAAATDATDLIQLQKKTEEIARINRSMVKILQSKGLFLDIVRTIRRSDATMLDRSDIKRLLHTWKGEFSFFDCYGLAEVCHKLESKLREDNSIVNLQFFLSEMKTSIETFLDQYDDILKIRSAKENGISISLERFRELVRRALEVKAAPELLVLMERLLEVPFSEAVYWLNEVWMLSAEKLGKKVLPIVWLESVPIVSEAYKPLLATLVHAVRNASDHGIEFPQERVAAGKPKQGSLIFELSFQDGYYHLKIRDDGKGINLQNVRSRAIERGLVVSEKTEIIDLVFEEDFTTRDIVSEFSGRGMGMSALRAEARRLGGDAKLTNISSGGTELHLSFRKKSLAEIFTSEM